MLTKNSRHTDQVIFQRGAPRFKGNADFALICKSSLQVKETVWSAHSRFWQVIHFTFSLFLIFLCMCVCVVIRQVQVKKIHGQQNLLGSIGHLAPEASGETNYKASIQDWHHLASTRVCRTYNVGVKYSFYTQKTTVFWDPVPSGNPQWTVSTTCVHPVEAGKAEGFSAADTLLLLLHHCSQSRCRYFITTTLQCCQLKAVF